MLSKIGELRALFFRPYIKRKTIEGVTFDFLIGDTSGREWYDVGCTDPDWIEMRFVRDNIVGKGDVVLECGGHHGCTTILLSNWVGESGKVVTFEALPNNARILRKNMEINRLKNVLVEEKAVGVVTGRLRIGNTSNSFVMKSAFGTGLVVDSVRLDDYLDCKPTVLKVDVEGYEVEVLRGAGEILKRKPKLVIEVHTDALQNYNAKIKDLLDFIDITEYKVWIQWADNEEPVVYDGKTEIDRRVHLFAVPI